MIPEALKDFEKSHPGIEPYTCMGTCEQCRKQGIFQWHSRARFFKRFGRICFAHICDDCNDIIEVIL